MLKAMMEDIGELRRGQNHQQVEMQKMIEGLNEVKVKQKENRDEMVKLQKENSELKKQMEELRFIEKNCWQGMEDYFKSLSKALYTEIEEAVPAIKRKSRRRRLVRSIQRTDTENAHSTLGVLANVKVPNGGLFSSDLATLVVFGVLILLVILNVMLYYKLWLLEDMPSYTLLDLHILKDPPTSHDEWIKLLQKQETLHSLEMQRWQKVLKTSIELLKQVEESLNELQQSIHPTYTNKIMSIIQNHKESVGKTQDL
ncbi:hypothetical protein FQA39_LY15320 [Lamprigera yunnana]|nr:hypothetical protein FQA39_LY15320 [Lamprigera yunnana]